jgi:hypothetical protein
MRIRVIQKPPEPSIDGIRLDLFVPGNEYEVGTTLGMLALADGWAEPVVNEKPALAIPLQELAPDARAQPTPLNLHRQVAQPYFDVAVAADAAPRKRRRGQTRHSLGRSDAHPNKPRRLV